MRTGIAIFFLIMSYASGDVLDKMLDRHIINSLLYRDNIHILTTESDKNVRHAKQSKTAVPKEPTRAHHIFEDITNDEKMLTLNNEAISNTHRLIMGYKHDCVVRVNATSKTSESTSDIYSIRTHTLNELREKIAEFDAQYSIEAKNIEHVISDSELLAKLRFEILSAPKSMPVSDFQNIVNGLKCVDFAEADSVTTIADEAHTHTHVADKLYFKYGDFGVNYKAPSTYGGGLKEQIIAVIDVGFSHHPDLDNAYFVNPAERCPNFLDDDQNGYRDDCVGYNFLLGVPNPFLESIPHGTPIAGLIAGNGADERSHVQGMCDRCKVLPLKAGSHGRFLRSAIAKAVEYASTMKTPVINASFGGKKESKVECEAIRRAVDKTGTLFVIASGNDGCDLDNECNFYPAECKSDNLIIVGGSNSTGHAASWSNYGRTKVHVFAPGEDVYTTYSKGGYKQISGTSFAAPIVASIAGDILTRYPKLTSAQVRSVILNSCYPVEHLRELCQCGGILDHSLALEKAGKIAGVGKPVSGHTPPEPSPMLMDVHRFNLLNRIFNFWSR